MNLSSTQLPATCPTSRATFTSLFGHSLHVSSREHARLLAASVADRFPWRWAAVRLLSRAGLREHNRFYYAAKQEGRTTETLNRQLAEHFADLYWAENYLR